MRALECHPTICLLTSHTLLANVASSRSCFAYSKGMPGMPVLPLPYASFLFVLVPAPACKLPDSPASGHPASVDRPSVAQSCPSSFRVAEAAKRQTDCLGIARENRVQRTKDGMGLGPACQAVSHQLLVQASPI